MHNNNPRTRTFVAACFGMTFFGITMVALGMALPSLDQRLSLTIANKATLAFTLPASILAGSLIFGPVCDRYGHRALFLLSCLSVLLGLTGIAIANSMPVLITGYVFIGLGGGVLNGQTNTIVSDLYDNERARTVHLSILGAFYGLGAMFITILVGALSNVNATFLLLALVVALVPGVLLCFKVKFPAPKQPQSFPILEAVKLLRSPVLVLLSLVLLFESSVESVTNNLATTYFSHINGAVLLITVMMASLTVARLVLIMLSSFMKPSHLLYTFFAILVAGFATMPSAQTWLEAMVSMALVGIGTAATYPIVLAHLGDCFKQLSGTAFGIAISIALMGSSLVNALVGAVLLQYFPQVMATAVVLMAALYFAGTHMRHNKKTN
ncbi:MAG: MFS transporter [Muribaculaceae bacterium]